MILSTRKSPFKSKYKAIVLVYASHNEEVYRNARENWLRFKDSNPNFKVLFLYAGDPVKEHGLKKQDFDLIYEDLSDTSVINGKQFLSDVDKTKRGIKYASENYEYDYIIRPNITSVLDLNALDKYLDTLPKENVYQGLYFQSGNIQFVLGANIIFSKDVAEKLMNADVMSIENEDINIGHMMHKLNIPVSSLDSKYYILAEDYTENDSDKMSTDIDNLMSNGAFWFRVKNFKKAANRELVDKLYYKILLDKLYPMK
jgi:hypothetical protein